MGQGASLAPFAFFQQSSAQRMKAWLQLFRVPNLFTVPGDPLAGFLIATGGRLDSRALCAVLASVCIYAAGLAMNDLADFAEDKSERPMRPLPSGAIARGTAWIVVANLILLGLGLCVVASGKTCPDFACQMSK
jgi:4-hydroxybenzoate polyprenyltransferase